MADSKKAHFSKSTILKIFSQKFLRFVLGLVGFPWFPESSLLCVILCYTVYVLQIHLCIYLAWCLHYMYVNKSYFDDHWT